MSDAAKPTVPITEYSWCWRKFGGQPILVTESGGAKVVLSSATGVPLCSRDEVTGCLRPLKPEDDVAELIASAPDLRRALQAMVDNFRPFTSKPMGAPHSPARLEQEAQTKAHAEARALLQRFQVEPLERAQCTNCGFVKDDRTFQRDCCRQCGKSDIWRRP